MDGKTTPQPPVLLADLEPQGLVERTYCRSELGRQRPLPFRCGVHQSSTDPPITSRSTDGDRLDVALIEDQHPKSHTRVTTIDSQITLACSQAHLQIRRRL